MLSKFYKALIFVLELFEPIQRWLTPYKFSFDDDDPEPVERDKRKAYHSKKRKAWMEKSLKKLGLRKKSDDSDTKSESESESKSEPKAEPKTKPKSKSASTDLRSVSDKKANPTEAEAQDMVRRGVLGIEIMPYNQVMDKASSKKLLMSSDTHIAYHYHDSTYHQLAVRFQPDSSFTYYIRDKNDDGDKKRAKMKPIIKPIMEDGVYYDKTHVI